MTLTPSARPTPAVMSHSRRPDTTLARRPERTTHAEVWADWEMDILPAAADHAVRLGAGEHDLTEAVEHPESRVPGFNGCIWHVRGHVAVLVSPDQVAMSVRRPETVPAPDEVPGAGRSLVPAGNRRWNPPTEPAEMAKLLHAKGFKVERNGSGHYRVTHPERHGKACVLPNTPSDHRWAKNFVSEVRHAFGIEIKG